MFELVPSDEREDNGSNRARAACKVDYRPKWDNSQLAHFERVETKTV